jgi:NADPH-dependent glutamate synthase beta subunit-like oxidoreductase
MPEAYDLRRIEHGVPAVAVSDRSTRANRTGSWKYIRPIYQDKMAPCNHACPAGVDVEATMNLMRQGKIDEAADLLLLENPFPATMGRVCPRPCETVCNRASFDQAVSVRAVERVLGTILLERELPAPAPRTRQETVGIVGAGPAGLTAAYHLARMGYGVTVYEATEAPGGTLRYGIPEYRLPHAVVEREIARITALGVEIRCGVRVGRDLDFAELDAHDAVLAATGATSARRLAIEGADLSGVRLGRSFLAELARGRKPSIGSRVVVLGGGSAALECACAALRLGASVTLVHHGDRDSLSAGEDEIQEAMCEGVRLEPNAVPTALLAAPVGGAGPIDGVESSFDECETVAGPTHVAGVRCVRLEKEGDNGSRREVPHSTFLIEADTVIVAPETPGSGEMSRALSWTVNGASSCEFDAGGERVFVCGGLLGQDRTVAEAIGSGKRAAIAIDHRLRTAAGEPLPAADPAKLQRGSGGPVSMTRWRGDDPVRRESPSDDVVGFDRINPAQFVHVSRHRERYMTADWTRRTFAEANLGLTRSEGVAEAARCFNCGVCNQCDVCMIFCPDAAITRTSDGRYQLSYKYCKGCGVCAAECPRCAMTMTREGL